MMCHVAESASKPGRFYIQHHVLKSSRWLPLKMGNSLVSYWIIVHDDSLNEDFAVPHAKEESGVKDMVSISEALSAMLLITCCSSCYQGIISRVELSNILGAGALQGRQLGSCD